MPKLGPCNTCQCYIKNTKILNQGSCLRFPPQLNFTPAGLVCQAPAVSEKYPGCFEHIPIEVDPKSEADKLKEKFNS